MISSFPLCERKWRWAPVEFKRGSMRQSAATHGIDAVMRQRFARAERPFEVVGFMGRFSVCGSTTRRKSLKRSEAKSLTAENRFFQSRCPVPAPIIGLDIGEVEVNPIWRDPERMVLRLADLLRELMVHVVGQSANAPDIKQRPLHSDCRRSA